MVIFEHLYKIYIWTYTPLICHFWINVNYNNNLFLFLRNSGGGGGLAFGSNGNAILGKEESWTTLFLSNTGYSVQKQLPTPKDILWVW
jgi:hypothetical protein